MKYSNLVFIAEGENIQVFFKVLKDLAQSKFEKVTLAFIAETPDEFALLSEVEYWVKSTKWTIDITVESQAPKDWPHKIGPLNSAAPYSRLPTGSPKTLLFASVSNKTRSDLSDRLVSKGYKSDVIRWFN